MAWARNLPFAAPHLVAMAVRGWSFPRSLFLSSCHISPHRERFGGFSKFLKADPTELSLPKPVYLGSSRKRGQSPRLRGDLVRGQALFADDAASHRPAVSYLTREAPNCA